MAQAFSTKITTESELVTFDFSQVLVPSETISSAVFTVIVQSGVDTNASAILSGSATINTFKVSQRVIGGLADVTYRIIATIVTSASNTYVGVGDLPVQAASEV